MHFKSFLIDKTVLFFCNMVKSKLGVAENTIDITEGPPELLWVGMTGWGGWWLGRFPRKDLQMEHEAQ